MRKWERLRIYYEAVLMGLALLTLILFVIEAIITLSPLASGIVQVLNSAILSIFIADYAVRFCISRQKLAFVRQNIPELLAILPFSTLFRGFRLLRLTRLTRLSRLSSFGRLIRVLSFARYALDGFRTFLRTNGLIYAIYLALAVVLLGGVGIYYAEGMSSLQDALWWSIVTATTVGYGDISPHTAVGRLIAVVLMISGIGLISMVTGTVATYFTSKTASQPRYRNQVTELIRSRLSNPDSLTPEDVEDIHKSLLGLVASRSSQDIRSGDASSNTSV